MVQEEKNFLILATLQIDIKLFKKKLIVTRKHSAWTHIEDLQNQPSLIYDSSVVKEKFEFYTKK